MLLGSGELGKEVLIALQRLGVETIAVDRYENAPGQQVAHHARTITMSDPAQLKALIEAERPHLVVPEIEAIATPMLEELEAAGTVRVIPTARAARLTMDREGIRVLAAETLGLPTSPYKFCNSLEELQAAIDGGIGYPCIVKPVMSSSGKGQSKIDGPADVQKAWDYAMAGGRVSHGRVIVEGFIDFDYEITQLTVRSVGADGQITTSFCDPIGHVQVSGDYVESWQPHPMHPAALEKSRQIAKAVTDNLGGQGLFGVELFVKGENVWFSEVSPARTTRAWSRCAPSTRASSSCTPAPSWACRWTPVCATPAPVPSSTAVWKPRASCSTAWKTPCACRAPICVCSASPRVL